MAIHHLEEQFVARFRHTASALGLDEEISARLLTPIRELRADLPVRRDDGALGFYRAYRIQHNDALGPCFGGVRCHPAVEIHLLRALAGTQMLQSALFHLPLGGAAGGIAVDIHNLSSMEREHLARMYVRRLGPVIGAHSDILAPELGSDGSFMAWLADQLARSGGPGVGAGIAGGGGTATALVACVTGKPISLGGSLGRTSVAGRGLVLLLEEWLAHKGEGLNDRTVAIHGFGALGRATAAALIDRGALLAGVADARVCLYNSTGFKIPELIAYQAKHGTLDGYPAQVVSRETFFELPVDVLIIASVPEMLTGDNAARVRAKVIVEGAPGAVTPQADTILADMKVAVVPDVIANAGAGVVSYFEWVQNLQHFFWDEEKVAVEAERILVSGFERALRRAEQDGVPLRMGAWREAIVRVAEAERLRGN